ncbi:enoyl-CoA hydratase/isomerase family protein [Pseudorhodoferax sp.]|uniref:enoyl-CoA hydratase/isomerase family protein n=1 Tax=Pseudorhodoferax sp. TaxID=1993553 RepID=UPI0039E348A1
MDVPLLDIAGPVATLTLRRPEQANRLEPQDLDVLAGHIATVNARPEVLVLRLASTGRYFCSGFDIGRIDPAQPRAFEALANALEEARPVTLALLQGGVYGGATDLALACDFRLGAQGIDLFMPAARLGLHFYARGMERYVSRLGLDQAKRLCLTAERIGAEEMRAIGFLTHLVAPEALAAEADALTARLAAMAPLALLGMKKHLNRIARGAVDARALEADIARAAASADLQEGLAAWAGKRAPRFSGR